jgi:hypothetical protein
MSENEFNRRTHQRMQEELAELDDPVQPAATNP